jgi:hypothetical protein
MRECWSLKGGYPKGEWLALSEPVAERGGRGSQKKQNKERVAIKMVFFRGKQMGGKMRQHGKIQGPGEDE